MSDDTESLDTLAEGVEVETNEPIEQPNEPTMEDTIRDTLDEITARGEGKEAAEAKERIDKRRLRERGPDGKYLAKPVENAEPDSTPAVVAEEATEANQVSAPVVPPELQRLGLRKEEAEAFAKADQVVRDAFMRRSEEMHKGLEGFRQKAQFGDQMAQAIAPFSQTIQQMGIHPAMAVNKLLKADHVLRNSSYEAKVQHLAKLASDYGIDFGHVQQFGEANPAYQSTLTDLQSRLQQMQSWIEQQNQAKEWNERQTLNSDIAKFASDPANEHFEVVRNDMAGLLQAGLASTLQEAYEKAIYANPSVRALVLAKQQAAAEEARKAAANQKAQAARESSRVNVPRHGRLPAAKPVGTMDDTIRAEAERLGLA